ncbi:DUF775-domain-containing protein [Rozella allomycis CSF55]|uniref:DUF775-domain-containing protein n=1 Tax=Rozella allomycis (strain CSF55) TaxID=988480 RepID=A0A075AUV2_ROZAC|nr:Protein of unknown function DUF775 domain-containing protein [Rozella allomycis CSF55]RKP20150.1 DUF775-domain-containing protein [Rozella allomycis CSF55]|eukprot:EPZ32492.1 Protein of unknown function DUF775 domain-containing protein [Rozella allomycis CSF55]
MFACLVSGRLVDAQPQVVDPTHYIFNLPNAHLIHHIAVFLTGVQPLPPNTFATIYFRTDPFNESSWKMLGYIGNEKPSAIFRLKLPENLEILTVGISIEPAETVAHQVIPFNEGKNDRNTLINGVQRLAENFFNYALSFESKRNQGDPNETVMPIKAVKEWFESTMNKLKNDANFLKKMIGE